MKDSSRERKTILLSLPQKLKYRWDVLENRKSFAAAVSFLASERASYITGQSLAEDGGRIKGLF